MPSIEFNVFGVRNSDGIATSKTGHANVTFRFGDGSVVTLGVSKDYLDFPDSAGIVHADNGPDPWVLPPSQHIPERSGGITQVVELTEEELQRIWDLYSDTIGTNLDYGLLPPGENCQTFAKEVFDEINWLESNLTPDTQYADLFDISDVAHTGSAAVWLGIDPSLYFDYLMTLSAADRRDAYYDAVPYLPWFSNRVAANVHEFFADHIFFFENNLIEVEDIENAIVFSVSEVVVAPPWDGFGDLLSILEYLSVPLFQANQRPEPTTEMQRSPSAEAGIAWVSVSVFEKEEGLVYSVITGNHTDPVLVSPDQITIVLAESLEVEGSQLSDTFLFNQLGSNVFGAAGSDTASFALLDYGIAVNSYGDVQSISGSGPITKLSNIENITGTNYDDEIEGRDNDNTLIGLDGDDTISGHDGDDQLEGGDGADSLYGGDDDDTLYGDEGNDWLAGNNDDDQIYGGNGRDTIYGGSDDDELFGQDGRDTLYGGTGHDVLVGGDDDDWLEGGSGNDELSAGKDDDSLFGEAGHDDLNGGSGNDYLDGGEDNDNLAGNSGDDTLNGREGDDHLNDGEGNDTLYGGDGNDTLTTSGGDDALVGGQGNDTIIATELGVGVFLNGGDGFDLLDLSDLSHSVHLDDVSGRADILVDGVNIGGVKDFEEYVLTNFDDVLEGQTWSETIYGGSGDDSIRGDDGFDTIFGGDGDDEIRGQDHDDVLFGGDGDDELDGDSGNDTIYGGAGENEIDGDAGNDHIFSGHGDNEILGRSGFDTVDYSEALASVRVDGDGSTISYYDDELGWVFNDDNFKWKDIERIIGTDFDDTIAMTHSIVEVHAGDGDDTITGGTNNDTVFGGNGDDTFVAGANLADVNISFDETTVTISGESGTDAVSGVEEFQFADQTLTFDQLIGNDAPLSLFGDAGNDTLNGGAGADSISGGGGDDLLTGGAGADEFIFDVLNGSSTITDFEIGIDRINLDSLMSQAATVSVNLNDEMMARMYCFVEMPIGSLSLEFEQVGDDVHVHATHSGNYWDRKNGTDDADPYIVLEDVDMTELSFSDFIF